MHAPFLMLPRWLGSLVLACLLLGACNTAKYLAPGEFLVTKNRIKLAEGATVDNWSQMQIELQQQIVTQPNGNFFFVAPREWFYYRNRGKQDSSRYRGFVERILAEPPALLDSTEVGQSLGRIRSYMLNRGYFDATVAPSIDTLNKKDVRVVFTITPGQPYRYRHLAYETENRGIEELLVQSQPKRLLQSNSNVDSRSYDKESARIVNLLRDNGYAEFYANSIAPLDADSMGHLVDATLRVLPPSDSTRHQVFRIGRITVFPDNNPLATATAINRDTFVDGIRFIYSEPEVIVKAKVLADNIFFREGQLYSQSAIAKTNRQLNGLGVFRFVSIQPEASLDQENTLDVYVYLSLSQRWEVGSDIELSVTDRQAVSGGRLNLIGTQVSGQLGNRNVAGGGERFNFSADVGVEFNLAELGEREVQRLNTLELGAQSSYSLPRFIDYFGLYRGLNRVKSGEEDSGEPIHFISDAFYEALRERATTRIDLGVRYVDLLNFYQTQSVSGTVGYQVPFSSTDRYTINHIGLEYFTVATEPDFETILQQTPFLQRSLGDQVFSAVLLRNIGYLHSGNANAKGGRWTIIADVEQSGFEAFLVNKTRNAISGTDEIFNLGDSLDYARYVRGSASFSYQHPLAQRQEFAFRFLTGTALTYGFLRRERDVPYVRQFFAGGSSSMRAWQARGVGPGAYRDDFALADQRVARYQQASFQLEFNAEYRSFLTNIWTSRLDGAIFLDAGNIWTWQQDADRPGGQFRFTALEDEQGVVINEPFYRQLAMNVGAGLRLDIGYVLFRFDVGVKLRNPYPINGSYFPRSFAVDGQNRTRIALGLNYPF